MIIVSGSDSRSCHKISKLVLQPRVALAIKTRPLMASPLGVYNDAMTLEVWAVFIAAVFIGSYLQSLIGFGMGLIVVAVGSLAGGIDFNVLTAAVSLFTLFNIVVALKGQGRFIDKPMVFYLAIGQFPAIGIGLVLLHHLSQHAVALLELLLGCFLFTSSVLMVRQPRPALSRAGTPACLLAGVAAGLTGGLFSASGPVMGWFAYRQPLTLETIRATLLSFFAIACVVRTAMVGISGGLNQDVLALAGFAIPVAMIGAWLGLVVKPPLREEQLKRTVFILLIAMATYIMFGAIGKIS